MDVPLISVGITYYRASDTIEKAVLSALAQTWNNTEIIVVDDHSNDGKTAILDRLKQQYPEIRIIYQTVNKGVAASRNEIIKQANGVFLAFFDDDDESLPERLEKQYARIISYEQQIAKDSYVICHTARLQKYPDGQDRYEPTMGTNQGIVPNGDDVALRILMGKPQPHIFGSTATCSQMARLSTYQELNGFDEFFRRGEDTEFNVRASIRGAHFPGIQDPLVMQTMTLTSDKNLVDEKGYALKILEKHSKFIKKYFDYLFCYKWVVAKYDFLQKKRLSFILKIAGLFLRYPILTVQRFLWSVPNIGFNLRFTHFHHDKK